MKMRSFIFLTKLTIAVAFCFIFSNTNAQEKRFWDNVQYGGAAAVGFGSGYTDINLAPSAVYRFNQYVAAGFGLQGSYVYQKDWYKSTMYGGSLIVLGNPIPQIQLSAELQQLRVNLKYDDAVIGVPGYGYYETSSFSRDFWNTALFLGAGYRMDHVTIGLRYNVLFNENDMVYSDALMPFIMIYF